MLIPLGMAVFLTLIGAFGTDKLGMIKSFSYWIVSLLGGHFIATCLDYGITKLSLQNIILEWILMFVSVSLIMIFFVWWLNSLFFEAPLNLISFNRLIVPVIVVSAAMTIVYALAAKTPLQSHGHIMDKAANPILNPPRPIIFDRLEPRFQQAEIFAVQAEDHYLKIYTSKGETMILMRLMDAVMALEGIEGTQVHRSWWVAKSAISQTLRHQGRTIFALKSGLRVPISRRYIQALKDMGWV